MSILEDLIETITEHAEVAFATRKEGDYAKFLRLYEEVGYAPTQTEARGAWRQQSCDTWRKVDALLPGTMTGGMASGELASSWGTLQLSPSTAYGHSVCMLKSLPAAATLFAQALHSLTWVETIPSIQYWAGSYANHSKFTSMFQEPKGFEIPNQLKLDVVRCVPVPTSFISEPPDIVLVDATDQHLSLLPTDQQAVFAELNRPHPLLSDLHSIIPATVLDRADGTPLALTLIQTASPELTAANVYSWTWVFSNSQVIQWIDLCRRMRRLDIFSEIPLQIALPPDSATLHSVQDENVTPSFWRFTPRNQLHLLHRSFRAAFESLLIRYSDEELEGFAATLNSERCLNR